MMMVSPLTCPVQLQLIHKLKIFPDSWLGKLPKDKTTVTMMVTLFI